MVTALMDGLRLPAGELAGIAGVGRPTASEHLGRLVDGGLLATERCGRHTCYRIADPAAGALSAAGSDRTVESPRRLTRPPLELLRRDPGRIGLVRPPPAAPYDNT
ncbi:ArsR/SmtB family transcription factor, partial [Streptomyces benahoarensis]